jgi:hypothetical protein
MRPECPSCEVIEILGCLYRKCKKESAENVKKTEQVFKMKNSAEKYYMVEYLTHFSDFFLCLC